MVMLMLMVMVMVMVMVMMMEMVMVIVMVMEIEMEMVPRSSRGSGSVNPRLKASEEMITVMDRGWGDGIRKVAIPVTTSLSFLPS